MTDIVNESFDIVAEGATKGANLVGKSYTWLYPWLIKIAAAIAVLLLGFAVVRLLKKIVHKILRELEINKLVKKYTKIKFDFEENIPPIFSYIIYLFAVVLALKLLGWGSAVLYIILALIAVIIIITFLLGVNEFIPNMFAGINIHRKKLIRIGDYIHVKNIEGTVNDISLIETKIITDSGDEIILPNTFLTQNEVVKKAHSQAEK